MNGIEQPKRWEYHRELPEDNKVVADFIESLHNEYPAGDFAIEKFPRDKSPRRTPVELEVAKFTQLIRQLKNPPIRPSIINEIIPGYSSKSHEEEKVLEFMARDFMINGEEHLIYIRIPDNAENRKKIDELIKKVEKKK